FPLSQITALPALLNQYPQLIGLNVTIPYKEQVLAYLDEIDEQAQAVGAVNTVRIRDGRLKGYNTDVYGFEHSLRAMIDQSKYPTPRAALVLGTGGAAKAVLFVLAQMGIEVTSVSRTATKGDLTYDQLTASHIQAHQLIVNTTPLGMSPHQDTFPILPYSDIGEEHFLYELVYNPEKTVFLIKGEKQGAAILNGLPMLHLQAERAWSIWQV
ncbi:MAG: shikimate dehydrogenase, partial [Bacteroidota bacterium]